MIVSFIIPAYNEEKYIAKCLESLINQKEPPSYEVIVVDNNSKDSTAEIVAKNFPSVRLVREARQGMTKARNRGAREAKGDILVFIDADSMAPEHWLQKMTGYFAKNPRLAGISGPSKFYDLPKRYKFVEFINFRIIYPLIGEFFLKNILRRGALWNGAIIAARRNSFEKVGGFSEEIVFYGEDADLAEKLMKEGEIAFRQDLWVWSSARRLLKGNPALEGFRYLLQYVRFFLTRKSKEKTYKEIR